MQSSSPRMWLLPDVTYCSQADYLLCADSLPACLLAHSWSIDSVLLHGHSVSTWVSASTCAALGSQHHRSLWASQNTLHILMKTIQELTSIFILASCFHGCLSRGGNNDLNSKIMEANSKNWSLQKMMQGRHLLASMKSRTSWIKLHFLLIQVKLTVSSVGINGTDTVSFPLNSIKSGKILVPYSTVK